jgi:hypothetical protein
VARVVHLRLDEHRRVSRSEAGVGRGRDEATEAPGGEALAPAGRGATRVTYQRGAICGQFGLPFDRNPGCTLMERPNRIRQAWTAQQTVEAVGFETGAALLIRDRVYGAGFGARVADTGQAPAPSGPPGARSARRCRGSGARARRPQGRRSASRVAGPSRAATTASPTTNPSLPPLRSVDLTSLSCDIFWLQS